MLLEHFDAILNSPSHLYCLALPFSPSPSWLHECYTAELLQVVKVVKGLPAEWGVCSRTVLLKNNPWTFSYWNNTIAVGSNGRDILILDAITGSQTTVFPGHTDEVRSLTFSSDGISLVSGSYDMTVKLWDVQTGGVVKTFYGHAGRVHFVSTPADHTTIVSGAEDCTLCLWDIGGGCYCTLHQPGHVYCAMFSPIDPQCFISVSDMTAQRWDISGCEVGPAYFGYQVAFSSDGTQFISRTMNDVTVRDINSGVVVAQFSMNASHFSPCCFSHNGNLVAVAAGHNICVWDITGSCPHFVETFVGHTRDITFLEFSSSSTLISASQDKSVKFWQIGVSSTDPKSTPLTLAPTKPIALKTKNALIFPSDLDAVMEAWGISTNLCDESLQILAEDSHKRNIQLTDNKLIFIWCTDRKINIWDAEKGKPLQTINVPGGSVKDLRVSGDGSKVFYLYEESIRAWDIRTGEAVGKVKLPNKGTEILAVDGSKVWIKARDGFQHVQGWDFGILRPSPDYLSDNPPDRLQLSDTKLWEADMSMMQDTVTGEVVFQLPGGFRTPVHVQWNGRYLVASFRSKEVFILDFNYMPLQ